MISVGANKRLLSLRQWISFLVEAKYQAYTHSYKKLSHISRFLLSGDNYNLFSLKTTTYHIHQLLFLLHDLATCSSLFFRAVLSDWFPIYLNCQLQKLRLRLRVNEEIAGKLIGQVIKTGELEKPSTIKIRLLRNSRPHCSLRHLLFNYRLHNITKASKLSGDWRSS